MQRLCLALVVALAPPAVARARTQTTEHHRQYDTGLIVAAIVMHDVGWALGWLGVAYDDAMHACDGGTCTAWPMAFIPIAGGLMAAGTSWDRPARVAYDALYPMGVPSIALELAGLALFGTALLTHEDDDVSISFAPSAPGALVGVSIDGMF